VAATARAWKLPTTDWQETSTEAYVFHRHKEYAYYNSPDQKQSLQVSSNDDGTWFANFYLVCPSTINPKTTAMPSPHPGCSQYATVARPEGGGAPTALAAITTSPHQLPGTPASGWSLTIEWKFLTTGLKKQAYESGLLSAVVRQLRDKSWLLVYEEHCKVPGR
jgi:hypothetical protein